MSHVAIWAALAMSWAFGAGQGLAQHGAGQHTVVRPAERRYAGAVSHARDLNPNTGESEPHDIISDTQEHVCAKGLVDVAGASANERRLVCSAASHALQMLGRCKIFLQRPVHVEIANEIRHPFSGVAFGLFDTTQERVRLIRYENISLLTRGGPYALLPEDETYKSVIVHELIHAAMHQNAKQRPTSLAAYEYPAYALQINSLSSNARAKFLQSIDRHVIDVNFALTDLFLHMDPFAFAASAYEHFTASSTGCANLVAILDGEVNFIIALPMPP